MEEQRLHEEEMDRIDRNVQGHLAQRQKDRVTSKQIFENAEFL